VFLFQLFARHVLACNRVFRFVFGKQIGRSDGNFWPRSFNLDIRDIRVDSTGRCLLYVERYVFNGSMDEMRQYVTVSGC
jgi:hypothetical protein